MSMLSLVMALALAIESLCAWRKYQDRKFLLLAGASSAAAGISMWSYVVARFGDVAFAVGAMLFAAGCLYHWKKFRSRIFLFLFFVTLVVLVDLARHFIRALSL